MILGTGACGRLRGDSDAELRCCLSGRVTMAGDLRDYCTEMPDGETCMTDAMCASRYCHGGRCKRKASPGEACPITEDRECANKCGRSGSAGSSYVCCPGRMRIFGFWDYCLDLNNGQLCEHNEQCKSGWCVPSFGASRFGRLLDLVIQTLLEQPAATE